MKRFFVIEADTEMYHVFVREVTHSFEWHTDQQYLRIVYLVGGESKTL